MVRIAHFADTHLGYRQYNLEEREKDIYDDLDEIGTRILEERPDIVIHSGDLFDTPRPPTHALFAFKKFLGRLSGKVEFFAVLGDHDKPKVKAMAPHRLFEDQIKVLGTRGAEHHQINVDGKNVLVAGISHLSKTYSQILLEELKKLEVAKQDCACRVLVLHEAIHEFFPFEEACELHLTELPKNFNYCAMGHLHACKSASHGIGKLAYPGSSEIIKKDEIAEWQKSGKGFNIVDIDGDNVEITKIKLESIRPQLKVDINYAKLREQLLSFIGSLDPGNKLPIAHFQIQGKAIDRQTVQQTLSEELTGKVLSFRQSYIEENEANLPELRPGAFQMSKVLADYLKDENVAQLASELLNHFNKNDPDGATTAAKAYFVKFSKEVQLE